MCKIDKSPFLFVPLGSDCSGLFFQRPEDLDNSKIPGKPKKLEDLVKNQWLEGLEKLRIPEKKIQRIRWPRKNPGYALLYSHSNVCPGDTVSTYIKMNICFICICFLIDAFNVFSNWFLQTTIIWLVHLNQNSLVTKSKNINIYFYHFLIGSFSECFQFWIL